MALVLRQFSADFPWLAKNGFGPSVKAERWNGRHAMFGCAGNAHPVEREVWVGIRRVEGEQERMDAWVSCAICIECGG